MSFYSGRLQGGPGVLPSLHPSHMVQVPSTFLTPTFTFCFNDSTFSEPGLALVTRLPPSICILPWTLFLLSWHLLLSRRRAQVTTAPTTIPFPQSTIFLLPFPLVPCAPRDGSSPAPTPTPWPLWEQPPRSSPSRRRSWRWLP